MHFIATGSFASEKTAAVMHLAAEQASLAKSSAVVTSLVRPGRTQGGLVYILETDDPCDLATQRGTALWSRKRRHVDIRVKRYDWNLSSCDDELKTYGAIAA